MANRFKGELTVSCEGFDYVLRMDLNAMGLFETETDLKALDWAESAEQGQASVVDMITMVHCCLYRHHKSAERSVAGDILSEDSTVLTQLFQAASPEVLDTTPGK